MRRALVLLLLLAASAAGILALSRPERGQSHALAWTNDYVTAVAPEEIGRIDATHALSIEQTALAASDAAEPAGSRRAVEGEPVAIVGRLFLDAHRPAAGARIEVFARAVEELDRPSTRRRGTDHGRAPRVLDAWRSSARATAASNGSFRLDVPVRQAGECLLSARHTGSKLETVVDVVPGTDREVGDLFFPAPGWIMGRLEDPGRNLPDVDMWVRVRPRDEHMFSSGDRETGRSSARFYLAGELPDELAANASRALVDPLSRTFVLHDVPSGEAELVLDLRAFPELQVEQITVTPGQENDVVIHYGGRNLKSAIWIDFQTIAEPVIDRSRLRLWRDGKPLAEPVRYRGRYLFTSLESGFHELIFDDPEYQSLRVPSLEPGHGLALPLLESASVDLQVVDTTME